MAELTPEMMAGFMFESMAELITQTMAKVMAEVMAELMSELMAGVMKRKATLSASLPKQSVQTRPKQNRLLLGCMQPAYHATIGGGGHG